MCWIIWLTLSITFFKYLLPGEVLLHFLSQLVTRRQQLDRLTKQTPTSFSTENPCPLSWANLRTFQGLATRFFLCREDCKLHINVEIYCAWTSPWDLDVLPILLASQEVTIGTLQPAETLAVERHLEWSPCNSHSAFSPLESLFPRLYEEFERHLPNSLLEAWSPMQWSWEVA